MSSQPQKNRRSSWRNRLTEKRSRVADSERLSKKPLRRKPKNHSWHGAYSPRAILDATLLWTARVFITLATIGLVAFLVQVLLTVHRPVPMVMAFASKYRPPFGPVPLTGEDRNIFRSLEDPGDGFFAPITATVRDVSNIFLEAATGPELLPYLSRVLEGVRPGGPKNDTIVVYLTAIGTVNADGVPCLVPPAITEDPVSLKEDEYLAVDRLLAATQAAVGTDVNVVVVLDCGRSEQAWPFGIDAHAFPDAVEKLVRRGERERLWVLLPASSGQTSLASPWQGGSNFASFFARGIRGAADLSPWGNGDGKVALSELTSYLTDRVDHWAKTVFGTRQTPRIFAANGKTEQLAEQQAKVLLSWAGPIPAAFTPGVLPPVDDNWLLDRWREADRMRSQLSYDRPVRWAAYQGLLARSEQVYRAGQEAMLSQGEIASQIEQIENSLSLPLTAYEFVLADERLAHRQPSTSSADEPASEAELKLRSLLEDPKAQATLPISDLTEWQQQVGWGWNWLTLQVRDDKVVSREVVDRLVRVLGPSPAGQTFVPVQLHFLQLLLQWTEPHAWQEAPQVFSRLIRSMDLSRETVLGWSLRLDRSTLNQRQFQHANQVLRRAVDLVFIGSKESLGEAKSLALQAEKDFHEIEERLQVRSRAIQTFDRINAELPSLLAWWSRERFATHQLSSTNLPSPEDVEDLLAVVRRYGRSFLRLAATMTAEEREKYQETNELRKEQEQAEQAFRRFAGSYLSYCEQLATVASDSPETLGAISRALVTPVLPADLRLNLLQRSNVLEQQFVREYAANPEKPREEFPPLNPEALMAGCVKIAGNLKFPVVAFFLPEGSPGPGGAEPLEDFARFAGGQAAMIRNVARGFSDYIVGVKKETAQIASNGEFDANAYLSVLEQASSVIHKQASLVGVNSRFFEDFDPEIPYLANLCHGRILSLTELALNDFWAALDSDSRPYCLEKAQRLLELAGYLRKNYGTRLGEDREQKLRRRLDAIKQNGKRFAQTSLVPNKLTLAPEGIEGSAASTIRLQPNEGVPEGLASVWFAEGLDLPPLQAISLPTVTEPLKRLPVALSAGANEVRWRLDHRLSQRLEEQRVGVLDFITCFRGHQMIAGIKVVPASAARTTRWDSRPTTPTRVTVHGEVSQVRSVAIVFDCSGSMGQLMSDGRTRLDAGRAAVAQLLNDLLTAGQWDVSLWLYGHRTQWSRDSRGRYSFKLTSLGEEAKARATKEEQPFKLVPGDDVEQVLPMQPLVPSVVAQIESLLAPLTAGGETPLYRAISEAIGTDFDGPHRAIPGHVLVVTDGANDQSGGQIVSAYGVTEQLARKNLSRPLPLRIDIIGYALEAEAIPRALRMGEVRDLAERSGGKFFEAADPTALVRSLRESLRLVDWKIDDKSFAGKLFSLGDTAVLPQTKESQAADYDIVLDFGNSATTRRLAAENNTSLQLYVAGGGRSLEFRRYDGGTEQGIRDSRSGLVDPLEPRRKIFFGAHLATRSGAEIRIPLSVQNDDAKSFSQRPTDIWFEVQPLSDGKPVGSPYVFYDPALQQDRTVPVFDLVCSQWPRDANSAAITAWVRFDSLSPDRTIRVSDLVEGEQGKIDFPGLPDSTITIVRKAGAVSGQIEIIVDEQHPAELASQLPLLRVQQSADCRSVVHVVEPDSGRVRHRFIVDASSNRMPSAIRIELTDKKHIVSGAVGTPLSGDPQLVVPIPVR